MYRGQRDSHWPLLPSALRASSWLRFRRKAAAYDPAERDERDRQIREHQYVAQFFWELDEIGFPIPGDGLGLREAIVSPPDTWPDSELFPFLAFAQHHGLPTRLLDWSESAYVAAYFAAIDALECEATGGDIVVWALNRAFIDMNRTKTPDVEVKIVHAARASNPYLHAQHGLFTLYRRSETILPLEQIIVGMLDGTIPVDSWPIQFPPRKRVMQKLTLPQSEAWQLLELLKYERVTAATMFPGPEGAIKRMIEPNHWRSNPPLHPLYYDDDHDEYDD